MKLGRFDPSHAFSRNFVEPFMMNHDFNSFLFPSCNNNFDGKFGTKCECSEDLDIYYNLNDYREH